VILACSVHGVNLHGERMLGKCSFHSCRSRGASCFSSRYVSFVRDE